jgi:SPP1 family predicted phage head-tail adaptor
MEIGKLNQRIAILEHHTRKDTIGNHKAQWEEVFSCWAAVSVNTSTETTEAGVTKEVVSLEFTVRQTEDTKRINSTTHKLRFRGLVYNITGTLPDYKSLEYMKIIAGTRKAGEQDDFY